MNLFVRIGDEFATPELGGTILSGVTRDSVRRSISTRMTEPSGMATGPSGKRSPDAICVNFGVTVVMSSPASR